MCFSQSIVLWQGRGGIQKIALFGKRPSPYYGKNSWNKQRETIIHHSFKTWKSVNAEHFKNFKSFFKCSCKNHQVLWWNWLSWGPPQEKKTQSYFLIIRRDLLEPRNMSNGHETGENLSFSLMTPNLRFLVPTATVFVRCRVECRWTDDPRMCGSHREAWSCDSVGVLCCWHCQWFV